MQRTNCAPCKELGTQAHATNSQLFPNSKPADSRILACIPNRIQASYPCIQASEFMHVEVPWPQSRKNLKPSHRSERLPADVSQANYRAPEQACSTMQMHMPADLPMQYAKWSYHAHKEKTGTKTRSESNSSGRGAYASLSVYVSWQLIMSFKERY